MSSPTRNRSRASGRSSAAVWRPPKPCSMASCGKYRGAGSTGAGTAVGGGFMSHTFHFDALVPYMIGIYYLLRLRRRSEVQPGDDMRDAQYRWWSIEELTVSQHPIPCFDPPLEAPTRRGALPLLERPAGGPAPTRSGTRNPSGLMEGGVTQKWSQQRTRWVIAIRPVAASNTDGPEIFVITWASGAVESTKAGVGTTTTAATGHPLLRQRCRQRYSRST